VKRILVFLLCLSSLAWPGAIFAVEEVINFSYVCRDLKGSDRWRAEAEIRNISPGVYLMTEKIKGVYSSFKGPVSWTAEMKFFRTKDSVRPMSLDKRVFDQNGKMIRRERQEFDLANNTATCIHEDPTRNIFRTKKFKFNKNVVTRLSLGFYAQKFLQNGKTSERLQMVSEEPNVYDIGLKRVGKEVIEVSGRKVLAYRLSIDPQLGALNFVKSFFPKSYGWHSAVPEYEWLGYEGLEGGINSEKVKIMAEEA
jgi:hypothetical protein